MSVAREPEYPSRIWMSPRVCEHPRESINFTGHFPPEDHNCSVFNAHCLQCGSQWTQADTDVPWDQLMLKLANGEFGVVSSADPEIERKVEWRRRTRYDQIMEDVTGDSNPILSSTVELKRPD
ncbi:hypothetical protein [Parasphingorhabdus pacifica]